MRILIVEDEKEIADGIYAIITAEGYESDVIDDGEMGLELIRQKIYDLILLDVMLPGMNGFDVLRVIREEKIDVPVIILTAKSMTQDKIRGLDLGANDYLTKPFDAGELLARIKARIRDRYSGVLEQDRLKAYDLILDAAGYKLMTEDKSIKLSNKEYQFMEYLMINKGIILSRETIICKIWGLEDDADYNSTDVYVSFLRKKMKFIGAKAVIVTKKGVGYSLEDGNG